MHEAHRRIEHEDQVTLGLQTRRIVLETGLGDLNVPVADLVPEEVLDAARHLAEGVLLNTLGHHARGLGQAAEHPGIGRGLGDGLARGVAIHVHEQETAGVPDLGDKGAGLLGAGRTLEGLRLLIDVGVELDVLVGGAQREQVVAHGIGTVHVDEVHGVHTVALGLGHAAAVLGEDRGVDHDVMERDLVEEVQRAHDHAGDPQCDDVARGDERRGGMMALELLGMLRPALRGEGPQLGAEPGVQHVLVLVDMGAAALGADRHVVHAGVLPATLLAVEHGNAVTPPQLTGDAPVFQVLHPGGVGLGPAGRVEGHATILDGLERGLLKLVHGDEPLLGEPGLKRLVAAVAMHDGMIVLIHVIEQVVLLEPRQDGLTALVARHAGELAIALHNDGMLVEDVDLLQAVGLAHRIVVWVVRRGDLDKAGAEIGVDVPIVENRDLAVDDGQLDRLAHERRLLGVLARNGDTGVAEHGLGARGGDDDVLLAVDRLGQGIAQMPKVALLILVLRLVVGDGGGAVGAPVDDALTAINQAVMVPVAKDLADRLGVLVIHGEALAVEVDGATHALDLLDDGAAVLVRPIPAGIEELLAPDLQAGNAFALQLLIHLGLRGDTGVVGTENPAGGATAHAGHANDGVLDGVVRGVTHVQDAGDVGRRDGDGAIAHALATLVVAAVEPLLQDSRLVDRRIVVLGHLFCHSHAPEESKFA